MKSLLKRILRWLGFTVSGSGPESPRDPYARTPAPVRTGPKNRSGAVAVAEPED